MKHKLHILVMIALLGGIIAPACGFMWGGQGFYKFSVIEICTAQGFENRLVMNEGDQNVPHSQMQDQCEFCFSSANIINLLPAHTTLHHHADYAEKLRFRDYEDIVLSRFNINTFPRGPPLFV